MYYCFLDESAGVLTAMPPQHISDTFGPMCNPHIKNKSVSTCQTPKSSKNSAVVVDMPKMRQDRLHVHLQALKICVAMLLHPLGLIAVHQSTKKTTVLYMKKSQDVLLDKQSSISTDTLNYKYTYSIHKQCTLYVYLYNRNP